MYHSYFNSLQGQEITYSYLANSLYGVPANQTSASINFSISNRLEMKVKSRSEEGTFKKSLFWKMLPFHQVTILPLTALDGNT